MKTWNKIFSRLTFLMAFPGIVIFFNISVYFFVYLFLFSQKLKRYARKIPFKFGLGLVLFMIGSVISIIDIPDGVDNPNFFSSLSVLPNYLYWGLLCLFLLRFRELIKYETFLRAVFWGVSVYIPFWFFRENFLIGGMPLVQRTSPNNLAFLMICYAPLAISYVKSNYSKATLYTYTSLILILMLFLERRAGFLLVGLSIFAIFFIKKITFRHLIRTTFAFGLIFLVIKLPPTENLIKTASYDIHQIIYNLEEVRKTDRSYLTRVAMWEKALEIYKEHPISGVGLINFHRVEVDVPGDFEGARFVIHKKSFNSTSAHNSYASALAEGGLALFLPLVLIILTVFSQIFRHIQSISPNFYPIFYSFTGMIIHYSAIVAYVNVYSWFITGMTMVVLAQHADWKSVASTKHGRA